MAYSPLPYELPQKSVCKEFWYYASVPGHFQKPLKALGGSRSRKRLLGGSQGPLKAPVSSQELLKLLGAPQGLKDT